MAVAMLKGGGKGRVWGWKVGGEGFMLPGGMLCALQTHLRAQELCAGHFWALLPPPMGLHDLVAPPWCAGFPGFCLEGEVPAVGQGASMLQPLRQHRLHVDRARSAAWKTTAGFILEA